jgi:hypothetical protein
MAEHDHTKGEGRADEHAPKTESPEDKRKREEDEKARAGDPKKA